MGKGTKRYTLLNGERFNKFIRDAHSVIFTYGRASEHADFFKKASKVIPVDEQQKGNIMLYLIGNAAYVVSEGVIEANFDSDIMFCGCEKLECIDFGNFDTSGVERIYGMFYNCASLKSLDLSTIDTRNVSDMDEMFSGCRKIKSLDLTHIDTSQVFSINEMFGGCLELKSIFVSDDFCNTSEYGVDVFIGCHSLVGGNGTAYDSNHIDQEYARIDKPGAPGYFTKK